jgi:hypothetical protein
MPLPDGNIADSKDPVGRGLKAVEDDRGPKPDSYDVKGLDKLELGLFAIVLPFSKVLTIFGRRTEVELGYTTVVTYARMTSTVGASVTVMRFPLWNGSKIVFLGMKSL